MEQTLNYGFAHMGIHCEDAAAAEDLCNKMAAAFGFPKFELPNSFFVTGNVEVMKSPVRGAKGHIAIHTSNVELAVEDLAAKGFAADMTTANYQEGIMISVYLEQTFGDFAVHLLRI